MHKNKKNKDHEITIISNFFHLRDGELISQEISSLRLGLESK